MTVLVAAACLARPSTARAEPPTPMPREFSFDLWDWTKPCQDLALFDAWAKDLKSIGVTRLEISAPWRLLEPEPNKIDLSFIADRLAIAKKHGLSLRVRINSYYSGATPAWYRGDFWQDINGKPASDTPTPPSIADERFWSHYGPVCKAIAGRFKGEDVYYNPFIGVHAELKWHNWLNYDPSTLAVWKKVKAERPEWLKEIAGDVDLPDVPPVPPQTDGTPDNSPVSKAWIAFREQVWRDAVKKFVAAIRAGDPDAKISAPLGESYRRQSAQFSNLDYWGLSRGASQVVHSYDFYWHPKDPAWQAGAAVASFRGITGLPVEFEFDGPDLTDRLHYTVEHIVDLAKAASAEGAGMKAANYTYFDRLPSTYPALKAFGEIAGRAGVAPEPAAKDTVLLFVSKWANYCYREKTEWLHEAQFGAWKMLRDKGYPVRFICEDNLSEDLSAYRGLYVAFSPPELLPASVRAKLESLERTLPSIIELSRAPERPPAAPGPERTPDSPAQGKAITLDYPLAYYYLHGADHEAQERLLMAATAKTFGAPR